MQAVFLSEKKDLEKPPFPLEERITLVFTDIESSTDIWEKDTDGMRAAVLTHNEITRQLVDEFTGYIVKSEGDSFFVAFGDSNKALRFVLELQQRLLMADWPASILELERCSPVFVPGETDSVLLYRGLRVRVGMHIGTPIPEIDPVTRRYDFYGPAVNKTARCESHAKGGAIVLSDELFQEVSDSFEDKESMLENFGIPVYVQELGRKELKGFAHLVMLRSVYPDALRSRADEELEIDSDDELLNSSSSSEEEAGAEDDSAESKKSEEE